MIASGTSVIYVHRKSIVELAELHRFPIMYLTREIVEQGGLMSYGPDSAEMWKHEAAQVHQILSGTPPGDIPFYQPTKLQLVINLKAASALAKLSRSVAGSPGLAKR
ncbi:MAG: hypothetical protein JO001_22595 [Alphaproteobacteria bacterium]|nr:hypothetical protein [Alphaproteobacteria bacterium]